MSYSLLDLPYDFDALEPFIDAKTMEIHHGKHHAGYVNKLNVVLEGHSEFKEKSVEDLLKDIESVPADVKQAVINNGGGHANHSLFWEIMCPNGKEISGDLLEEINNVFGSLEDFKKQFEDEALKRFGSGWVWLIFSKGKLEIISTTNQDSPLMQGRIPILGLDVWEHAYYLKYQNKRIDYVEAWWNVVNWEKVSELFEEAKN